MYRVVFILFLFSMSGFASAQVVINEIAWMGMPTEGVDAKQVWRYEWVELHNVSDTDISVAGWSMELYRDNLDFVIPLQGVISAKGYFVAASSHKIKGVDVNYASLVGKFTNSGQRIILRDRTGREVELIDATNGWFAGDNDSKLTMERRFADRDSSDPDNWGSSMLAGGTPKAKNSIFQKEAVLNLDSQKQRELATKKSPFWAPFSELFGNSVFIQAFLLSLGAGFSILLLRAHLFRKDAGSSDVLRD